MRFESPWAFLLLLIAALCVWLTTRKTRPAATFPTLQHARAAGRSWKQRLIHLPLILRTLALVCLVVAIARPQEGRERVKEATEGIAIQMVLDRSGSMRQEMEFDGAAITRLEVVKRVFRDFVLGDGKSLKGRPADMVGLIQFARYADTICPLTLGHDILDPFIKQIQPPLERREDGTAIGDALALAAARLQEAEKTLGRQTLKEKVPDYVIKSKVIILLTDGISNAGTRTPLEAAALAKKWGIKIYCIGIGSTTGYRTINHPFFGKQRVPVTAEVDERLLRTIAQETGGEYFNAPTGEELKDVYKTIDELETSELHTWRYLDYREQFSILALVALGLLAAECLLRTTVLRTIP